ncbi:hypothetical protein RM543_01945 [Roseicyclus sp. F158]|uniref:Uncharacterized protein n=1 Tax=Tropicimonas omnivorans TaxID=3075590 RepID=A0ABU3DCJ8_9RHOB|nr:hypothetical protein [Roseicyclus sp. F158]MDT0681431.1 hypothetical protein [Roseicyclus sp. F158]
MQLRATALAAGLAACLVTAAATAQEATFDPASLAGDDTLRQETFTADAALAESTGRDIPVPFTLEVPVSDRFLTLIDSAPSGGVVKISFALGGEEGRVRLLENLNILTATLPEAEDGAGTGLLDRLLTQDAFPLAVQDFPEAKQITLEDVEIGGTAGRQLIGTYRIPSLGLMYLRLVALPDAEAQNALVAIVNIDAQRVQLASTSDLESTITGRALESLSLQ